MNISSKEIVSNAEMTKNYKACREKAERVGKLFVMGNNRPDAVLFSIAEYERLSVFIEYLESLEDTDIAKIIASLPSPASAPMAGHDWKARFSGLKGK